MKKKYYILIFIVSLILCVQGCHNNSAEKISSNNEYNFFITNNTPITFKSIILTMDKNEEYNLIDSNIGISDTAKFSVPTSNDAIYIKIILNPKDWYSSSYELEETFKSNDITEYQIIIDENNEVSLKKL